MKKLFLMALAICFTTTSMFAFIYPLNPTIKNSDKVKVTNADAPRVAAELIRSQIIELIESPQFHVEEDLDTVLTFTFSSEGHIVILDVDNRHRDLLRHVRDKLNYKIFELPGKHRQVYKMPLKVKAFKY